MSVCNQDEILPFTIDKELVIIHDFQNCYVTFFLKSGLLYTQRLTPNSPSSLQQSITHYYADLLKSLVFCSLAVDIKTLIYQHLHNCPSSEAMMRALVHSAFLHMMSAPGVIIVLNVLSLTQAQ